MTRIPSPLFVQDQWGKTSRLSEVLPPDYEMTYLVSGSGSSTWRSCSDASARFDLFLSSSLQHELRMRVCTDFKR